MKKFWAFLLFSFMFFGLNAQNKSDLPNITLKNLDGQSVNVAEINNDGKPFVLAFWATWCDPDIRQFDAWTKDFDKWVKKTGVKVYAVSINNQRDISEQKMPKIKELINKHGWPFEFLFDPDRLLQKAMSVPCPPMYFLFDGNRKIVYQRNGYYTSNDKGFYLSDEKMLYEELLRLSNLKSGEKELYDELLKDYSNNSSNLLDILLKNTNNELVDSTKYAIDYMLGHDEKHKDRVALSRLDKGKPVLVCFADNSQKSIDYLNELSQNYNKWDSEIGVKIYVITAQYSEVTYINNKRITKDNPLLTTNKQWPFTFLVYDDVAFSNISQKELKGYIPYYPFTYLFNSNKKMIIQYAGYRNGLAETIYKDMLHLLK